MITKIYHTPTQMLFNELMNQIPERLRKPENVWESFKFDTCVSVDFSREKILNCEFCYSDFYVQEYQDIPIIEYKGGSILEISPNKTEKCKVIITKEEAVELYKNNHEKWFDEWVDRFELKKRIKESISNGYTEISISKNDLEEKDKPFFFTNFTVQKLKKMLPGFLVICMGSLCEELTVAIGIDIRSME